MKKLFTLIITLALTVSLLSSCTVVEEILFILAYDYVEDQLQDLEDVLDDKRPNADGSFIYTDFTSEEKRLFTDLFGFSIPFAPNNDYYFDEYVFDWEEDNCYEEGINFCTYGNTRSEFEAYKALFSTFTYDGREMDEDGDYWYYYSTDLNPDCYIDLIYYYDTVYGYVIDLYVYYLYDGSSGSGSTETDGIITNEGKGLPKGENGVYKVDLTDAKYVKSVRDQGYYLEGCPTTGRVPVLVIPVEFSDETAASSGYEISSITTAFTGESDYYSVEEYYYISSYGSLELDFTVLDQWFMPSYSSDYYENLTMDHYGEETYVGDQAILDEALDYLEHIMDLSEFDSDGNGIIDAVIMVNTLEVDDSSDFNWAYRYWNEYTDGDGYFYEYDGVSANDYIWMSCGFLHECYGKNGEVSYSPTNPINTFTAIHEFAHILGADDYYDTSERAEHPMNGLDVMDAMPGDHNPYTKFNLGWITESMLITTDSRVSVTISSFVETGDSVIIANNWDTELGAYQEYYVIMYYTADTLNSGDYGYFLNEGIVVYHINASLCVSEYEGESYYDVYNNNTHPKDAYGTENYLVEFVTDSEGEYVFLEGDSLPYVTDDSGNRLGYTFTVDSISDGSATIIFEKLG